MLAHKRQKDYKSIDGGIMQAVGAFLFDFSGEKEALQAIVNGMKCSTG